MDLAYHQDRVAAVYRAAMCAQVHEHTLDRSSIDVFTLFIEEALAYEGFSQTPQMRQARELLEIFAAHYTSRQ